jgi:hypothetical protein
MEEKDFVVAIVLDAKNLHRGIEFNPKALGETFDLEVLPVVAIQKKGMEKNMALSRKGEAIHLSLSLFTPDRRGCNRPNAAPS